MTFPRMILSFVLVLFFISCTLEKRIYRRGYYFHSHIIGHNGTTNSAGSSKNQKNVSMVVKTSLPFNTFREDEANLILRFLPARAQRPIYCSKQKQSPSPGFISRKASPLHQNIMAEKNYGISCNSLNVAVQYQDPLESNDPDPKSKPFGKKLFLGILIAILLGLFIIGGAYFPGLFAILSALSSLMAGNVTVPKDIKHPKRYVLSVFLIYILLAVMYAIIYFTAMTVSAAIVLQLIVFGSLLLALIIIESKMSKTKA